MPRALHVCIFTSAHPTDDVRVHAKFAKSFIALGHRVTWVGPGHAFFQNGTNQENGIRYHLLPRVPGIWNRIRSLARLGEIVHHLGPVDIIYAPDPDSARAALGFARKVGAKLIFDIHEIYHEGLLDRLLKGYRLPWVRAWVRNQIAKTARKADLTIGVSASVLHTYLPIGSPNGMVVRSCAPALFAEHPPAQVCGPERRSFTIMHGKNHPLRGTDVVMEAVSLMAQEHPRLKVLMFNQDGPGAPSVRFQERLADLGILPLIDLLDGVPMSLMPGILQRCDAGLIAYDRRLGIDSLPNRLFEYMALGIPILAPSYSTEIASIIEAERCGLTLDFENPRAVADAITYLMKNPETCRAMGQRAREAFLRRHSWEVEFDRVVQYLAALFPEEA